MGLCAFAAPAFSATVLQFGKGGASNGTATSNTTKIGAMDVGILTVNVDGNSSIYTFTTGGFLHFDFQDTTTDTFSLKTTGATVGAPATSGVNNTLATSAGTGAPGAIAMNNLAANTALITGSSSLAVTLNNAATSNYSISGTVSLLNSFLADLGIASGSTFTVSGGFSGLSASALSSDTVTFTLNAVPEPSSVMLFGTGLLGMAFMVWKRKKAQA